MNHQKVQKLLTWTVTLCLLVGNVLGATAAAAPGATSDFEALEPLMDLVACTVITLNADAPEAVPGPEGTLSNAFISGLFRLWQNADPSLGLSKEMVASVDQQTAFLSKVFAAQLPALEPVETSEQIEGYIGFRPVTVNTATEMGGIQIVGEIYWSPKPLKQMTDAEYKQVQWQEPAVFTFKSDASALNGFRLAGFSVGTELNMEQAMQSYFSEILVEYVNTGLGFSLQYPGMFTDDLLTEDDDGVSAQLKDGTASFFAKRVSNESQSDLEAYMTMISNGITDCQTDLNKDLGYATVTYNTDEGFTVFDVYIVTERYIYQAELSYRTELSKDFSMYDTYLKHSFMVDEVSVG